MKKIIVASIVTLALCGVLSAQAAPAAPQAQAAQATVKLSGKLEVINGRIGLKADGTSYVIPRLSRLVGFVKELQEGATVKVEGYSYPIPEQNGYSVFHATKLTIGTKDYDLGQVGSFGPGSFGGKGMMGGGMGAWGADRGRGGRGGMMGGGQGYGPRR